MLAKIAVLAFALIVAWMAIFRPMRALSRPKRTPRRSPPAPLEACPRCGVYRPAGDPCDCGP